MVRNKYPLLKCRSCAYKLMDEILKVGKVPLPPADDVGLSKHSTQYG
jgi:hypothetical protein